MRGGCAKVEEGLEIEIVGLEIGSLSVEKIQKWKFAGGVAAADELEGFLSDREDLLAVAADDGGGAGIAFKNRRQAVL